MENKTGASGRIGVQFVKDAAPDGNTLFFVPSGPMTLYRMIANLGYHPVVDFVPVSEVATTEIALAVSGQLNVHSLRELATWLASNPDKATYATPGAGSSAHFVGAEFGRASGLPLRHVAYRGAPAAFPDVLSNRVPILCALTGEMLAQHKSGGVVILAVASSKRSPFLPDVPTFKESDMDILAPNYLILRASAHFVRIVGQFEAEILAAMQDPAVKDKSCLRDCIRWPTRRPNWHAHSAPNSNNGAPPSKLLHSSWSENFVDLATQLEVTNQAATKRRTATVC